MNRVPSRYVQVALTYTGPWTLRIWFLFAAIYCTWITVAQKLDYGGRFAVLMIGGSLAAWGGPILASHAKEQMADSRSRLTPRYRTPHLVIAAILFTLAVGGISGYSVYRLHQISSVVGWPEIPVSLLGYGALILLATMLLAWMAHSQSVMYIFIVIGSTAIALIPRGQEIIRKMIAGEHRSLAWSIVAISMAGFVVLWWRLARMHEEMAEYWKVDTFNSRLRVAMTGDRQMRRVAAIEAGWFNGIARGAERLDHLANVHNASFWKRARHWGLIVSHARGSWAIAAMTALGLATVYYLGVDHSRGTQMGMLVIIPAILSLSAPSLVAMATWPQRWFVLGGESLWPVVSRGRFLREQAAAKAMELASLWVWFTLGAFLPGLILQPGWILSIPIAAALGLIVASQVFLFSVAAWVMHLRLNWFFNFGTSIAALIACGILLAWQIGNEKQEILRTPSPLWACLLIVLGAVILLDAHRRWLKTDLD